MALSHRLSSSMSIRPDEGMNVEPKMVIFLSVEGKHTEKDYFEFVNKYREQIGIQSIIQIETLYSSDTYSDPKNVLSLLFECAAIKESGILPQDLKDELCQHGTQYSIEQIESYIDGTISDKEKFQIDFDLKLAGIDINYQRFLSDFNGSDGRDIFAIVIDRDKQCNRDNAISQVQQRCNELGYYCFLSNPCFEFWLLLHLCDVYEDYNAHFDALLENKKVSNKHTYVSNELVKRAGHSKRITEKNFKELYLDNIDTAIGNAGKFERDETRLINNLGTNLPELFKILRQS